MALLNIFLIESVLVKNVILIPKSSIIPPIIIFDVIFSSKKSQAKIEVSTAWPSKLNETRVGRICCVA